MFLRQLRKLVCKSSLRVYAVGIIAYTNFDIIQTTSCQPSQQLCKTPKAPENDNINNTQQVHDLFENDWMISSRSHFIRYLESTCELLQNILVIVQRTLYLSYIFSPNLLLVPLFYISILLSNNAKIDSSTQTNNTSLVLTTIQTYWWELLKESIRKSGPCLTKFAQWISTRPDLFPLELCSRFQDLQFHQNFTPYTYEQIISMLNKEYGYNSTNSSFCVDSQSCHNVLTIDIATATDAANENTEDVITLGAGCIAQAVKGKLVTTNININSNSNSSISNNNDSNDSTDLSGQESRVIPVAIKIVHPDIKQSIEADITIMKYATRFLESLLPQTKAFSLSESVDEFSDLLLSQLDLRNEGINLNKFRKNFHVDDSERFTWKLPSTAAFDFDEMIEFFTKVTHIIKHKYKHIKNIVLKSISSSDVTYNDYEENDDDNVQVITFPKPYDQFCTSNILVEDYVEGVLMSTVIGYLNTQHRCQSYDHRIEGNSVGGDDEGIEEVEVEKWSQARKQLAKLGLEAILKMVFEDNFIHADLHPGNIICQEISTRKQLTKCANSSSIDNDNDNKYKNTPREYRLVLIDAGLTASLSKEDRKNFIDVFNAIVRNEGDKVGQLMIDRSKSKATCLNPEEFKKTLKSIVSEVHKEGLSLKNISVGALLQSLLVSCYIHQVKLEAKFISLILAICVLEGLGRRLDPDVDILQQAAPYVIQAAVRGALYSMCV